MIRILLIAAIIGLPNINAETLSPPKSGEGIQAEIASCKFTAKGKRELNLHPVPDFTQGGRKDDKHDWNLGPTGARGWMWGLRLRTDFARQILITKVDKASPADGVLMVGDVILGIGGKRFESDARIAMGKAIANAGKEESKGLLALTRWRNGQTETVCAEHVMTMKEHGSQDRIIWLMKMLAAYGTVAKQVLPDLYKAREHYVKNLGPGKPVEFPQWATDKFMQGLNEGIRNIEQTTAAPPNLQALNL